MIIGINYLLYLPKHTWHILSPASTSFRLISYPPAQPTTFYQRVSIKVGNGGVESSSAPSGGLGSLNPITSFGSIASGMATGLAAAVGRDFIANRPFMFGFFDSETNTCLYAGAFSQPGAV